VLQVDALIGMLEIASKLIKLVDRQTVGHSYRCPKIDLKTGQRKLAWGRRFTLQRRRSELGTDREIVSFKLVQKPLRRTSSKTLQLAI